MAIPISGIRWQYIFVENSIEEEFKKKKHQIQVIRSFERLPGNVQWNIFQRFFFQEAFDSLISFFKVLKTCVLSHEFLEKKIPGKPRKIAHVKHLDLYREKIISSLFFFFFFHSFILSCNRPIKGLADIPDDQQIPGNYFPF